MNTNGNFRYRVNDDLSVEMWSSDRADSDTPNFYQPFKPGGVPFASLDDANSWTEAFLSEFQAPKPIEPEVAPEL